MINECEFANPSTFPLIFAVKNNDAEQIMKMQEHVLHLHKIDKHDPSLAVNLETLQKDVRRYKLKQQRLKFSSINESDGNANLETPNQDIAEPRQNENLFTGKTSKKIEQWKPLIRKPFDPFDNKFKVNKRSNNKSW